MYYRDVFALKTNRTEDLDTYLTFDAKRDQVKHWRKLCSREEHILSPGEVGGNSHRCRVKSAFGGFALYKTTSLKNKAYTSKPTKGNNTNSEECECEHTTFHSNLNVVLDDDFLVTHT